jgi:hypothetical protein
LEDSPNRIVHAAVAPNNRLQWAELRATAEPERYYSVIMKNAPLQEMNLESLGSRFIS